MRSSAYMKVPSEEIYDKSTQGTLKSTFIGLQRCRWQYGSIFIRSAVVSSEICEIPHNSLKNRTDSSSRSSKVIDLGHFLLVFQWNHVCISSRFRDTGPLAYWGHDRTGCRPVTVQISLPRTSGLQIRRI